MASTVLPKKSSVVDKVPSPDDLQLGELAINIADGKIYSKDASGVIVDMTGALEIHAHTISQITGLRSELDSKANSNDVYNKSESNDRYVATGTAKKDALSNKPSYLSGGGNQTIDLDEISWGDAVLASSSKIITSKPLPFNSNFYYIENHRQYSGSAIIQKVWEYQGNRFCWRSLRDGHAPPDWAMEYTDQNTSVDRSGFVRASGSKDVVTEAPNDGSAYVRVDNSWVKLEDYLYSMPSPTP